MTTPNPKTREWIDLHNKLQEIKDSPECSSEVYEIEEEMAELWPWVNRDYLRQLDEEGLL